MASTTVSGNHLRRLMRQWATGVTLVTALDSQGPHGMTVSSFTSVSLDPALILVSLERGARTHQMVEQTGHFAVVILRDEQRELAERFAGGVDDGDSRFEGVPYELTPGGAPIPSDPLAYLDCQVVEARPAGTHTVFLGLVTGGQATRSGLPLLYYNRDYRRMAG
jgi:flavin reductase (DIM6/NTAB) family NADH-FMN oxidoreductase RutF